MTEVDPEEVVDTLSDEENEVMNVNPEVEPEPTVASYTTTWEDTAEEMKLTRTDMIPRRS